MDMQIELTRRFDHEKWQIVRTHFPTSLLTWELTTDPIDAGLPVKVRGKLSAALISFGPVLFADKKPDTSQTIYTRLKLKRGLLKTESYLVSAEDLIALEKAFEANGHDWSQGAQWLMLTDRDINAPVEKVREFTEQLYGKWIIPGIWPDNCVAVLQAGVDGDALGIVCKDEQTLLNVEQVNSEYFQ